MFVKKLSLCFCIVSLFAFNQVDADLREDLSKRGRHVFSALVFDEMKALIHVVNKGDQAENAFLLMWEEAKNGNEKVQEKLLLLFSNNNYYEKAKNRVPALNDNVKYSLNSLIEMGIRQEKPWAFYQKAMMEEDEGVKYTLLNQAINNSFLSDEQFLIKVLDEREILSRRFLTERIPAHCKNEKNIMHKDAVEKFINHFKKYKNGTLLFDVYTNTKKNKYLADECLKAAADIGSMQAAEELAKFFLAKADIDNGYKWNLVLAKKDNIVAMNNHVRMLLNYKNYKDALPWLLKIIEGDYNQEILGENFVECIYTAGNILKNLLGKYEYLGNKEKAFNFLTIAAEKGHINAMIDLGEMWLSGFSDKSSNPEEAAKWFLKAAENGTAKEKYIYGFLLKKGFLGQKDRVQGNYWIQEAANEEYVPALNHVGGCLMGWDDETEIINKKKAYHWFLKAAQKGDTVSKFNVSKILGYGLDGINIDLKQSKKWVEEAADEGYLQAKHFLAERFIEESKKNHLSSNSRKRFSQKALNLLEFLKEKGYFDHILNANTSVVPSNHKAESVIENIPVIFSDDKVKLSENFFKTTIVSPDCKAEGVVENISVELTDTQKENFKIDSSFICSSLAEKISHITENRRFYFNVSDAEKELALYNLAILYCQQERYDEAFKLFLLTAKNYDPIVMKFVADAYKFGLFGQEESIEKEIEWYLCAAEKDHVPAMVPLAKSLLFSSNLAPFEKNIKDALFWLKKADSLGDNEAKLYLAMCKNLVKEDANSNVVDAEILQVVKEDPCALNQLMVSVEFIQSEPNLFQDKEENVVLDNSCELQVDFNKDDKLDEDIFEQSKQPESIVNENLNVVEGRDIKNPKYVREQLRKMGELMNKYPIQENDHVILTLSEKNKMIVDILLDNGIKHKRIDYTQLKSLFEDPFFDYQVEIKKTKSGCIIKAKNLKTGEHVEASTHKKHNKTYDGLNPFFARDLVKILEIFGLATV